MPFIDAFESLELLPWMVVSDGVDLSIAVDCSVSGTTAVLAHIAGRKLTLAWVGDSRGVLCRTNAEGQLLTETDSLLKFRFK